MSWFARSFLLLGLAGLLLVGRNVAVAEIRTEFAMDSDPQLVIPNPVLRFSRRYKPLWLSALARPEADMQRLAAETIAQAHAIGVPELIEATPTLIKILSAEDSHPTARTAAARALIALEAKDASQVLFDASRSYGADLRQLIEPALARWKFEPIRDLWQKRLTDAATRHRELMLAIEGLGHAGDDTVASKLLLLVHDPLRPAAVRLAAARSASRLKDSGLESDADHLTKLRSSVNTNSIAESASIADRLCAVALLERHKSEAAQSVLLRLARDTEPSVTAAALTQLNVINHDLVLPLVEQAIAHDDVNVRQQGANAYIARPTPERAVALAKLLDDVHPRLRANIREALFTLAQNAELDATIRQAASGVLAGESWRGQEQAALLLSALDHKPAAPRLMQLLESPRTEVLVTAAWGLRKLAVPETFPAMLDRATRLTELRLKTMLPAGFDEQVAHLLETFGVTNYRPAESLLRQYIPKVMALGDYSRGAAIWSLGHLHRGVPDEPLAALMVERLVEPPTMPTELVRVRTMSAVSLGRMQAKSQVQRMRTYLGPTVAPMVTPLAIRWAIHQLTGELLPDAEPSINSRSGWFLEPLDE